MNPKRIAESDGAFMLMAIFIILATVLSFCATANGQDTLSLVYNKPIQYEAPIFAMGNKQAGVNKKPSPRYETHYQKKQRQKNTLVIGGLAWTFCFIVLVKTL